MKSRPGPVPGLQDAKTKMWRESSGVIKLKRAISIVRETTFLETKTWASSGTPGGQNQDVEEELWSKLKQDKGVFAAKFSKDKSDM